MAVPDEPPPSCRQQMELADVAKVVHVELILCDRRERIDGVRPTFARGRLAALPSQLSWAGGPEEIKTCGERTTRSCN